jgi:hypothetical protein
MFSNTMADYFEENTATAKVTKASGDIFVAVDGIILIHPGWTIITLTLSNPRNLTVLHELTVNSAAIECLARQTSPGEIEVEINDASVGEEYDLILALRSSDGLRDFAPHVIRLRCVSSGAVFLPGADLSKIGGEYSLDGEYYLTSDVTLPGSWNPIGPFTGNLDGGGHIVVINGFDSSPNKGLFGSTDGAEIKNLNIVLNSVDINSTAAGAAGGVTGTAKNTTLENITVTGSMAVVRENTGQVGGLVGEFPDGFGTNSLTRCAAHVNITATLKERGDVGGLVGKFGHDLSAAIEECYSTGNINVTLEDPFVMLFAGGLVGLVDGDAQVNITNSYATGNVSASMSSDPDEVAVGGLIGQLRVGLSKTVRYCYASGTVSSSRPKGSAGGLCGEVALGSTAQGSAALSPAVSGGQDGWRGRVVGYVTGTLTGNIANSAMTVNGSTVMGGAANNENGANTVPAAFRSQSSYTALGWDFTTVWKMNPAAPHYPILRWQ